MANGLIKMLDVIASLGLQTTLFGIGISQYGIIFELYLAYSLDKDSSSTTPREVSRTQNHLTMSADFISTNFICCAAAD